MSRHFFILMLCLLLSPLPAAAKGVSASPSAPAPTDEAQRIWESRGDAIYQVQVIDLASGKKSSIGSGFQFTADGVIATNYHVVADVIRDPRANRLEYVHDKGEQGALKILSADVVHDLAILKMDKPGKTFIQLGKSSLPRGTKIFAIGNPHDIGFTIVEGTYNGYSQESFVDKIHFSGALNPGMSGGPALSHDGTVVGINVSTAGNQIGFLVPVEPLAALYAGYLKQGAKEGEFIAHADAYLEKELLQGQKDIAKTLLSKKWESVPFGPLMVPGRIHPALKCWGEASHKEKDPYRYYTSLCATQDSQFLGENFETGSYSYRYDYLTGDKMDPFRFYSFYENQYSMPTGKGDAQEDDVTNYDCNTDFVTLAGRRWKSSFCVRQYRRFPAIYDMQLSMAMVGTGKEGMLVSFEATGVSKENALALSRHFISEIRARPEKGAEEGKGGS